MNLSGLVVKPEAEYDISSAYLWYENRQAGLGKEFLSSLESTFDKIIANSSVFMVQRNQIRRARILRFPYTIFFKVENNIGYILTVVHEKRGSKFLIERLEGLE